MLNRRSVSMPAGYQGGPTSSNCAGSQGGSTCDCRHGRSFRCVWHRQGGMPLSLFAMMDSVMTLREAVRCGKSRPLALQPAVGTLTMRASGAGVSGGGRRRRHAAPAWLIGWPGVGEDFRSRATRDSTERNRGRGAESERRCSWSKAPGSGRSGRLALLRHGGGDVSR